MTTFVEKTDSGGERHCGGRPELVGVRDFTTTRSDLFGLDGIDELYEVEIKMNHEICDEGYDDFVHSLQVGDRQETRVVGRLMDTLQIDRLIDGKPDLTDSEVELAEVLAVSWFASARQGYLSSEKKDTRVRSVASKAAGVLAVTTAGYSEYNLHTDVRLHEDVIQATEGFDFHIATMTVGHDEDRTYDNATRWIEEFEIPDVDDIEYVTRYSELRSVIKHLPDRIIAHSVSKGLLFVPEQYFGLKAELLSGQEQEVREFSTGNKVHCADFSDTEHAVFRVRSNVIFH